MKHYKRLMRILTTIDTIWLNVMLPARSRSDWTSQSSYEAEALPLRPQSVWATPMCFYRITAKSNETLEAAHAHIDDDRYDMVECGAAGQIIKLWLYEL